MSLSTTSRPRADRDFEARIGAYRRYKNRSSAVVWSRKPSMPTEQNMRRVKGSLPFERYITEKRYFDQAR